MFNQPYKSCSSCGPNIESYDMSATDSVYYLTVVNPVIEYGLKEAAYTNVKHAMTEVAVISYLMGMGYNAQSAHAIVESWETNEQFESF